MADEENEPQFPVLLAGAVAMHENLMSFVEAGFTRQESLQIVMMMLRETIRMGAANSAGEGSSGKG